MKFFSELRSCYCLQATPASVAPSSSDNSHHVPHDASDGSHRLERNRTRRYGLARWQPALSSIVEDSIAQNYNNNFSRKSGRKSFGKGKSTTTVPDQSKRISITGSIGMTMLAFSPMPFMF